jgi:predicted dehydrogenase
MSWRGKRVAVIGCGAIAQSAHLPALAALRCRPALLVDQDGTRARTIAQRFKAAESATEFESQLHKFDAAVVALPHNLHESVCSQLLRHGKDVLVEKPMALTAAECQHMITSGEEGHARLAVGHMRRFLYAAEWTKAVLAAGLLGPLVSFDIREGTVHDWQSASNFHFQRQRAGGGVLMGLGVHTLDLLIWWMGEPASFDYYDDCYGGLEADCELHLGMACGAMGTVELSRTRNLRNTAIIRGTKGQLEVSLHSNQVEATPREILGFRHHQVSGHRLPHQSFEDLFVHQARNWLQSLSNREGCTVSGEEAARPIALIEECYRNRRELCFPWTRPVCSERRAPTVESARC